MKQMTFEEYQNTLQKAVEDSGTQVFLNPSFLATGKSEVMMSVLPEGKGVSPAFRLHELYEEYLANPDILEAQKKLICDTFSSFVPEEFSLQTKISFMENFDSAKDKLFFYIINKDKNQDYLRTVPHVDFLDLSIVFRVLIADSDDNLATAPITNAMLDQWGIRVDSLWSVAQANTISLLGLKNGSFFGSPFFVLTNQKQYLGAGTVLVPKLLKELSDTHDSSFYILPSSIHEVLLVPVERADEKKASGYRELVRDVNQTQVEESERLSDEVYFYDRTTNQITFA